MKIALCHLPAWNLHYPAGAPAILKGVARRAGHDCCTFDFAYDLFNAAADRDMGMYDRLQSVLVTPSNWTRPIDSLDYIVLGEVDTKLQQQLDLWLEFCLQQLEAYQPDVVGLSVFSYWSHKSAMLLTQRIRQRLPTARIMLGGRGTSSTLFGSDRKAYLTAINNCDGLPTAAEDTYFSAWMLSAGLADVVLEGDAEQSFAEWLSGGVDTVHFVSDVTAIDMSDIPYSDFDDYDLPGYPYHHERALPLSGSKGCVRACTFCDVPKIWPKFLFKDGHHVADEMTYLNQRYGAKEFYVTDSLANGSMVAFLDFLRKIADYKEQGRIDNTVVWTGHYITRPAHQIPPEMYALMAQSGAQGMGIGVESGSDRVRDHMKKKFSTDDLNKEMAQFSAHGITAVLLFFSGYPTETWDDFVDTVNMFYRYQRYAADGTLQKLALGTPYQYIFDTPMDDLVAEYNMTVGDFGDLWIAGVNPTLHYLERIRRRMILQEVCCLLNLPVSRNYYELLFMMNTVQSKKQEILDFFGLDTYQFELHPNITGDSRLGQQVFMPVSMQQAVTMGNNLIDIELVVDYESDSDTWYPELKIQIGNQLHCVSVQQKQQTVQLHGHINAGELLSIGLTNQPQSTTHFWAGGDANHYSCKQVILREFRVNGVNILKTGHIENYFEQTITADPVGTAHIHQLGCWPTEHKHKWRLWTNMVITAHFQYPAQNQLCLWALDDQADMTPNWEIMDEFKQYLIDFDK